MKETKKRVRVLADLQGVLRHAWEEGMEKGREGGREVGRRGREREEDMLRL